MEDEEIAASGFEGASLERFFEEFLGWGEVCKKGSPGADLGFACALNDDV